MLRPALSIVLILPLAASAPAQTAQPPLQQQTPGAEADHASALRLDIQGLDAEARELREPLARAAAAAEVADLLWKFDEESARRLLWEALELVTPEDGARERPGGMKPGAAPSPEETARRSLRGRILRVAASHDASFERELFEQVARTSGAAEQSTQLSWAAARHAREGRLGEAADYARRAMSAYPFVINIAEAVNELAARDRASADRLAGEYVERLRAVPPLTFAEQPHAATRLAYAFAALFLPNGTPFRASAPAQPLGRAPSRAYLHFVVDLLNRMEQERPGSSSSARSMLMMSWPFMPEYAPELAGQFAQLERLTRKPGQAEREMQSLDTIRERAERAYEERIKLARRTKDALALEAAVNSARARGEFKEARELLGLMPEGAQRTRLAEALGAAEALHLAERGETAAAEKAARQLGAPHAILRAYPPLIRQLVRRGDNSSAALLASEAVRRLKRAEEEKRPDDVYVPSALAGVYQPPRGSRLARALAELAVAVAPASDALAFELLEELVRAANKHGAFTTNGDPGFDPAPFRLLAARDARRARQWAEGFDDRLQRVLALAAVLRQRADALAKR